MGAVLQLTVVSLLLSSVTCNFQDCMSRLDNLQLCTLQNTLEDLEEGLDKDLESGIPADEANSDFEKSDDELDYAMEEGDLSELDNSPDDWSDSLGKRNFLMPRDAMLDEDLRVTRKVIRTLPESFSEEPEELDDFDQDVENGDDSLGQSWQGYNNIDDGDESDGDMDDAGGTSPYDEDMETYDDNEYGNNQINFPDNGEPNTDVDDIDDTEDDLIERSKREAKQKRTETSENNLKLEEEVNSTVSADEEINPVQKKKLLKKAKKLTEPLVKKIAKEMIEEIVDGLSKEESTTGEKSDGSKKIQIDSLIYKKKPKADTEQDMTNSEKKTGENDDLPELGNKEKIQEEVGSKKTAGEKSTGSKASSKKVMKPGTANKRISNLKKKGKDHRKGPSASKDEEKDDTENKDEDSRPKGKGQRKGPIKGEKAGEGLLNRQKPKPVDPKITPPDAANNDEAVDEAGKAKEEDNPSKVEKTAFQSSTFHGAVAGRAIDNNWAPSVKKKSCSRTRPFRNGWWVALFKSPVLINGLRLQLPVDCCWRHMHKLEITVDNVICSIFKGPVSRGKLVEITCKEPLKGTEVKIRTDSNMAPVALCEVAFF